MASPPRPKVAGVIMGGVTGNSPGQRLEHDHHRIDDEFARFAGSLSGSAVDREAFDGAALALRHHIYVEEVHHFPVVKASGLMGPILVMLREHGEIWDLLDNVAEALDGGIDAAVKEMWPRLATVLKEHNMKEEKIVYPAGDQQLPAEVAEEIVRELESGAVPEGWVCQMAGRS